MKKISAQLKEIQYVLALSYIKGLGPIKIKKLLNHFDDVSDVFKLSKDSVEEIDDIGQYIVNQINKEKNIALKLADIELDFVLKNNIDILYYKNSNYPDYLKNCIDCPLILFSKGYYHLEHKKIISIVGTRNKTNYGYRFINDLVDGLKEFNPVIVSGLALGCDVIAHGAAIRNDLQTIGVLAHGLNQIYPYKHKDISISMLENGGLISEFSSFHKPIRENFLKRNRIVAGISSATIIVESAKKGGSITTAKAAFNYNREVLALPGNITNKYSEGCNDLIKSNIASLITSSDDIIRMLNWENDDSRKLGVQKQLFVHLNDTEQIIYNYLNDKGDSLIDQLALDLEITIPNLSVQLLNMELKGVVSKLSGKLFRLI